MHLHDHNRSHADHAHHAPTHFGRVFAWGMLLNVAYVIVEVGAGFWTESLALLADAGHNLSDILSLGVAWFAHYLSALPATKRRTFGWRSATILAAQFNGLSLVLVAGGIVWESFGRFGKEPAIPGGIVAVVAILGVMINGGTAYLFHRHSHDLNARAVYWHMLIDALVSVSVIVTGIVILATGWFWVDTVTSVGVSIAILWTTFGLLRDAFGAAMLSVPNDIDPEEVNALLANIPGVVRVRDIHIWTIGTSLVALTAHLVKPDLENDDELLAQAANELREKFGIGHTTIQIERNALEPQCELG